MGHIDWVRSVCLSLPGATEQVQWGNDLVFKVSGKMFAVTALEPGPLLMSFKCSPEDFADLCERPGAKPAPYLARALWVAVEHESSISKRELEEYLRRAYRVVVAKLPKRLREQVMDAGGAGPSSR